MGSLRHIGCLAAFVTILVTMLPAVTLLPPEAAAESPTRATSEDSVVHLYFADRASRYLRAEQRLLKRNPEPVLFARQILSALVEGSRGGLTRILPEDTTVRAVFLTAGGTAYVDLSQTAADRHPGGVRQEQLSVFAVVNSLVLNMDTVQTVKILINGQEVATLAGHVDLRHPLKADMLLVR